VTCTGLWFSPVSSTNTTDRHDIAEILLNVALNTTKQTNKNKQTKTNMKLVNFDIKFNNE
jgi:hypothetical protein